MRLSQNLLAAFANAAWTAIITLAVVPVYLKYLGIGAYGLIGFFATMQALFQILDAGFAPTITREVARRAAVGKLSNAGSLLHTLAIVYWVMAGLIAIVVITCAPAIAQYWLHSELLTKDTLERAVMLVGLVICFRFPIALYKGALMGAERFAVVSAINMAMLTVGNLGAVAVLDLVSPTIDGFFVWQAGVGAAHTLIIRWAAWRALPRPETLQFNFVEIRKIWRFSAGMSGVAISALLLTQLDKVLLSTVLSVEEFGHYALAAVVASGLYVLLTPVFNVLFPRLSFFVAGGDSTNLINLYRSGTRLFLAVLFPIATFAAVFSNDLVHAWTGNAELASNVAPIVSLLVIGTALNGVMHFPYALQLANGMTRLPLTINGILMIPLVPMTIILAMRYGAAGGAASWLLLNAFYLLVGTWLTHRYLLKGLAVKWLLHDVAIPLALAVVIVGGGGFAALAAWQEHHYINLLFGSALVLLASAAILAARPPHIAVLRISVARGPTVGP